MQRSGVVAGATAALAASGAATAQEGLYRAILPPRAATFAGANDAVTLFVLGTMLFFFVLVVGLTGYFAVRYRRRPGVPQQRSRHHNLTLELAWSGIPLLLCVVMFWWGFKVYMDMHVAPAQAELITVKAKKWSWTWEYPNGGIPTETVKLADKASPVFMVPMGRPVKLIMQSDDVIHSLFIPAFRKKLDVFPNRYTTFWFHATREGDYPLFCAEYCGDDHSQMMALVKVRPDAEYRAWLAELANTDKYGLLELGQRLYVARGCNSCHSLDGTAGTGPTWKDVYGTTRQFTDGSSTTADMNYMRESILNPGAKVVQGFSNQMPTFQGQLKDRELQALIVYMMSLSEKGSEEVKSLIEADDAERAKRAAEKEAGPSASAGAGESGLASR
ncbi:cytochrome c oxidase subunit II [Geitlerinema splendidum]|nr:cytochrome c oxidase subunit II [Geitlerinema splendidum]